MRRLFAGEFVSLQYQDSSIRLLCVAHKKFHVIIADVARALDIASIEIESMAICVKHDCVEVHELLVKRGSEPQTVKTIEFLSFFNIFKSAEEQSFKDFSFWLWKEHDALVAGKIDKSCIGGLNKAHVFDGHSLNRTSGLVGVSFSHLRAYLQDNGWITRIRENGSVSDRWLAAEEYVDKGFLISGISGQPLVTPAGIAELKKNVDEILESNPANSINARMEEQFIVARKTAQFGDKPLRMVFGVGGNVWYSISDVINLGSRSESAVDALNKTCKTILTVPFELDKEAIFATGSSILRLAQRMIESQELIYSLTLHVDTIEDQAVEKVDITYFSEGKKYVVPQITVDGVEYMGRIKKVVQASALYEFIKPKGGYPAWLKTQIEDKSLMLNHDYFTLEDYDPKYKSYFIDLSIAIGMAYEAGAILEMKYLISKLQ